MAGTMNEREIAAALPEFEMARARGEYFPKAWIDRLSLDDAYRILLALSGRRSGAGGAPDRLEIGLTAPAIQQQFGVHEPVFACLFADGLVQSGHVFRHDELIEPGFENELCLFLDRDLPQIGTRGCRCRGRPRPSGIRDHRDPRRPLAAARLGGDR